MQSLFSYLCAFFDSMNRLWDSPATERALGVALLWIYVITLACVELKRLGYYPEMLPAPPGSHFYSIQLAFTLILGLELIGLIFILPASLSKSIGKQLELLTLILLRNAFKELAIMQEPINITLENIGQLLDIAGSGGGALAVFICLGIYRAIIRPQNFHRSAEMLHQFIQSKKLLSLFMLTLFIGIGIYDLKKIIQGNETNFFETIYTVLIFADIAMVLIAQRYMPCYYAVFRNSGYVIGTLLMRLSLSAPPLLCASIATFAALYVLALTWSTNRFRPEVYNE